MRRSENLSWEAEIEQVVTPKSEPWASASMCGVCQFEGRNHSAAEPMDFLGGGLMETTNLFLHWGFFVLNYSSDVFPLFLSGIDLFFYGVKAKLNIFLKSFS